MHLGIGCSVLWRRAAGADLYHISVLAVGMTIAMTNKINVVLWATDAAVYM
jgi:hypothetical protein